MLAQIKKKKSKQSILMHYTQHTEIIYQLSKNKILLTIMYACEWEAI